MLLKKEINVKTLADNVTNIDLFSVACYDYYKDVNQVEVRVEYTNDVVLYVGEEVNVTNTIERNDVISGTYPINISENYAVAECDKVEKRFSIIADKYQSLSISTISIEIEANVMYLHFTFDDWHFFRSWETYGISFMVDYNETTIVFSGCEYVNDYELRWRYDANKIGIDDFMCHVFSNDAYEIVDYVDEDAEGLEDYVTVIEIPETACFTDEMLLKQRIVLSKSPECIKWALFKKVCNDGTVFGLVAYRLNYKFKDINLVSMTITTPIASIDLPLSLSTGNDTYSESNVYESFIDRQTKLAINSVVEMEKLVYHPVFKVDDNTGCHYKPINKIKFNLHFRQRGDGWVVNDEGLWNGMNEHGLLDEVYDNEGLKFFSYAGDGIDKGRQSDLLCYLGFNDSDVKYQKSKLKKSFIRLSFYDSPNRANQNLLSYSTIYLDSGVLFSKMMKGAGWKNLYVKSGSDSNMRYDNAKVNTEPCFEYDEFTNMTIEDIENYRLSSQITVCDRFSQSCSEGFYLYLWADNDNGSIPSDIYMRVDFNHAGYGRVVPMTMPYLDNSSSNGIYTMEEIASIWCADSDEHGWGIRANEKFSYIRFKYTYDSVSKRYVYYLDPDTYGLSSYNDGTPNELELNLYEPKIRFE